MRNYTSGNLDIQVGMKSGGCDLDKYKGLFFFSWLL